MSATQKNSSDVTEKADKSNTGQENKKISENKKVIIEEEKSNNAFIRRRVWPD